MVTFEEKKRALEEIALANDGIVTPELVVEAAREEDHILHELFEWDVKVAAYNHWLHTARVIISSIHINVRTRKVTYEVPVYVHNPLARHEQSYINLEHATIKQKVLVVLDEVNRVRSHLERLKRITAANIPGLLDDLIPAEAALSDFELKVRGKLKD